MLLLVLAGACAPFDVQDSGPRTPPAGLDRIPEPTPREEPRSRYGNPDSYEVFGRTYHVMDSARGYEEEGIASWYGKKFHGERTSSGEEYDMYALTAAHTRLPLPTYVRVTNLENDRSLVVRVNDRGPFAHDRLIDLSYAAAHRLGFADQGTARVRVEALTGQNESGGPSLGPIEGPVRIQVGAFRDRDNALALKRRLESRDIRPVRVESERGRRGVHRVRVGPLDSQDRVETILGRLRDAGIQDTSLVRD
ncbi:septal ring lytic transglycosylase RlpA family protein [Gammaproteobacteria bacterium AB-CW1]|uniref:Endolytic peptidoglycan transglycosylase RlpA n=2 Tax=Natronospira TaxID=2024969 RepID=A0AAP6JEE8_9GAMM|nr:septal ring lytic transglycosylase RlpA family protein [Gammaproteobacteria bacterium AB-CW1]